MREKLRTLSHHLSFHLSLLVWDQTGKTFTTSSDVFEDVGHAAPGVHGEGAHLALKRLAKIILKRLAKIIMTRMMTI